jgi:hypothetical protein
MIDDPWRRRKLLRVAAEERHMLGHVSPSGGGQSIDAGLRGSCDRIDGGEDGIAAAGHASEEEPPGEGPQQRRAGHVGFE